MGVSFFMPLGPLHLRGRAGCPFRGAQHNLWFLNIMPLEIVHTQLPEHGQCIRVFHMPSDDADIVTLGMFHDLANTALGLLAFGHFLQQSWRQLEELR